MSLTPEQKNTVAEWMGWRVKTSVAHVLGTHTDFEFMTVDDGFNNIHFSLNDAALCVNEMQIKGKFEKFIHKAFAVSDEDIECHNVYPAGESFYNAEFFAWLMTMESGEAVNFFTAMAAWIEEEKKQ